MVSDTLPAFKKQLLFWPLRRFYLKIGKRGSLISFFFLAGASPLLYY